jgi:MFS family permease
MLITGASSQGVGSTTLDAVSPTHGGNEDICKITVTSGVRTWHVGTLAYTTGGLLFLFALLLAGDFAWSIKERSVGPIFTLLLKKHEASDFMVGILTGAIPAAISILLGPLFSVWSDRARTRWGRRIPFLLVPTPFIVLSMVAIGFSADIGAGLASAFGRGSVQGWIIATFAVFWTVFEVFTIIANVVFSGLVCDVVPRQVIGRFYGLFRSVSLGAGILFNYAIIGHAEQWHREIFFALALLYGIGFMIMCCWVKEGEYPPPETVTKSGMVNSVKSYAAQCASHSFYRISFVFLAISALCFQPLNAFSLFAAKSYGMNLQSYGEYTAISFVCSLILAFPLGCLTDRCHPLRVGGVCLLLYALVMMLAYFLVDGPWSFGMAWIAHVVLSGCFFTATAGLGIMIFPSMSFTQFASAAAICTSLANMVFVPAFGRFLDVIGNDYSYSFLFGSLLALLALFILTRLYLRFYQLGGPTGYIAPQPGSPG